MPVRESRACPENKSGLPCSASALTIMLYTFCDCRQRVLWLEDITVDTEYSESEDCIPQEAASAGQECDRWPSY